MAAETSRRGCVLSVRLSTPSSMPSRHAAGASVDTRMPHLPHTSSVAVADYHYTQWRQTDLVTIPRRRVVSFVMFTLDNGSSFFG